MPEYRNAYDVLGPILSKLIKKHHYELDEAGVTVESLWAVGELKHHGYPAAAVIKIMSQEQRAAGSSDCRLKVSLEVWDEATDMQREALLMHELEHLVLLREENGAVKTDDCHRPRLKCKLHDWELGGFASIAERYGDDAMEVRAARQVVGEFGQILFPWMATEAVA